MNLKEFLIKKANPYRDASGRFTSESNAVSISKPKSHHSEAVKNTFKNARSKKAKQLLESRAANKKPKILREEEFLAINGVGRNTIGEAALHRSSNNKSRKTHSKDVERQRQKDMEIINQREKLRKIYQEKLKSGEIKEPTSTEYLSEVAAGDPMLDSTQAAQRVLEKRRLRLLEIEKAKTQKSELLSTLATIYRVKKANPYKDETGKWTSKDKAKTIAEWFYEGGKEQIKRTSAGLAGAAVGGLAGAGAGSLVGSGLAAAGSSYLTGAASGLTSIPLLGESLSGLAKASAPTAAGIATGAALGSMAGLGVLGIGAGAYLGAKTAGAAVGGYLGAKGGYEVGTALYDSNLSEKIEEWKSNAKDKASAQTDKLKDTVKARVGDLKNKASKEFDAAKQKTHAAIESKAAQAKELIKQKANEAKNKAKAAATSKLKELTTRYKPIKKYDLTALRNA